MFLFFVDDYNKAIKKLKQSEVVSDILSSDENDAQPLKKRQSTRPKRLSFDTSSDEEDHRKRRALPLPPPISVITNQLDDLSQTTGPSCSREISGMFLSFTF